MSKETFEQMIARVTAKRASNSGAPPAPPKLPTIKPPTSAPTPKR